MSVTGKWCVVFLYFLMGFNVFVFAQQPARFHADLIVVKLKSTTSSNGRVANATGDQLSQIKQIVDYEDHLQVFPNQSFSNARLAESGLNNIYKLKLRPETNIWQALAQLKQLDIVQYAEPLVQNELLLIPNDPQAKPNGGLQDYLTLVRAYDGWQIDQSDSNMVIGIIDTGVNMKHEDLGNLAFNYADPINGLDDDGDGYIDNFHGWDLSDSDNDPTADVHPHGTQVAGMSSATTNNGKGMAGIGFKSKYLPVKIYETASRHLTNEYEGIIYAANHGCKVINLSWGGAGEFYQYGQDIINYVVLEKDVVVVASAGNTPEDLNFYPASFDHVLSVGSTDINDNLATWATYSHKIDIMAPGNNVYSTKNDGGYEKATGSSFSSPMVAGAAALVRSHFPELSAIQVMEQLRITSDNIYAVGSNMDYYGKMGHGRLNVHSALSDIITPSVRISDVEYSGNHGSLIFPGDTLGVVLTFTNYLRKAENVSVTITNPSGNVNVDNDKLFIASLGTFEDFKNDEKPIRMVVGDDVAPGEKLIFRVDFVGNSYTDFQYIEIRTTPQYFDISDGKLTATITSDGDIGFDDAEYEKGNGISYIEKFISANSGLIISLDENHVLDNVVNNFDLSTRDQDFMAESALQLYDNSIADFDARSVFKPQDTTAAALPLKIEQEILAWKDDTNDGSLVFEYRLINTGDSTLTGLNAALFADWDLEDFESNQAAWDSTDHFGYAFDKASGGLFAGMALLTNQSRTCYAIDKVSLNGNTADIDSLFSDKKKHQFLSSNPPKTQAGMIGPGNDIAQIVGGKEITIQPEQSIKITFAMMASNSLEGLRAALQLARSRYAEYNEHPPVAEIFYACRGEQATIDPAGKVYEFFADPQMTIRLDSGKSYTTAPVLDDQIYYAINLDSAYASDVMTFVVKPGDPLADFAMSSDTLLIESGKSGTIKFKNTTSLGGQWQWDFGNGYKSTVQNPSIAYQEADLYDIKLIASNSYGCSDTTVQQLRVGIRSVRAVVENQQICKGEKTGISASNTTTIKVYTDNKPGTLLFEGSTFETGNIDRDTVFYVVNAEGTYESVATPVSVFVKNPAMGFEYALDTLNMSEKYVLHFRDTENEPTNVKWTINGQLVSEASEFDYHYQVVPMVIVQTKTDDAGCSDTLRQVVSPTISAIPVLHDNEICQNSNYTIEPENGNMFFFYNDAGLQNLVHKGRIMHLPSSTEAMTYYVTGVDQLLESPAASIHIAIDPVKAQITTSADTVDLASMNEVTIRNSTINAAGTFWLMPGGSFDTTRIVTEVYEQPGEYQYTALAISDKGCTDTVTHNVRVVSITGLNDIIQSDFRCYPNPVSTLLYVQISDQMKQDVPCALFDPSGKTLQTFTLTRKDGSYQLDMSALSNGMYFVRSLHADYPFAIKVIKQ